MNTFFKYTKKINMLMNIIRSNSTFYKISNLSENKIGENVQIKGWIKGLRKMKKVTFVDVCDGSCTKNLQIVVSKQASSEEVSFGASIEAEGILSLTPKGQTELHANKFTVLGECPVADGFPFPPNHTYPPEYIRDYLHLRTRVDKFCSMLRFRHNATRAFNNFLADNNFIQIHTPLITSNDCEGAGEIFSVQPHNKLILKQMAKENIPLEEAFFDKKTFLTVSGQLHLEAMAHGLGNVYTFGPTFRAENSKSPIHLSEFYMLEAEKCFVTSIEDVTNLIENMTKQVTTTLLNSSEADIFNCTQKDCSPNLDNDFKWLHKNFPIIDYNEAVDILKQNENQLKSPIIPDDGLTKDHELFLTKHLNSPLFVIDWPTKMKPFYMRQKKLNPLQVEGVDFLVPNIGELAGGSIREDNYEFLKLKIPMDLNWYLELRKYGGITTGGFGLGFERYIQFILNIVNIKDVIPFPRWAHNCNM